MAFLALLVDDVVINKFELDNEKTTIGRAADNAIQIEEAAVSSTHAQVVQQSDPYMESSTQFFIEDLESTNSTRVNGSKITRQRLFHNDLIEIGYNKFRFVDKSQVDPDRTAVIITE